MALPELKQAHSLINKAAKLLLIVPERPNLDAIASMMALYITLQNSRGNGVDEVSAGHVPRSLQFLPGSSQVKMKPRQQTEIILDIAGPTEIGKVRREPLQGGLRVHIPLPDGVAISKDQLATSVRPLPYDAAVVLGAADLEALGKIFTDYTDFFYNTPIINIDHQADNEHFGTVNLVDVTAGSVAEVVYDLVATIIGDSFEPAIATALYAGVVAGTDSFQKPSTTPRSFQIAARLMELEADREAVIQHIIKTKPLSLIKLAGRLYARLRYDEHLQLFWSILRPVDFAESGAKPEALPQALRELSDNIAGFNAAFVLNEVKEGQFEMVLMLGKGMLQRREKIGEQLKAQRDDGLLKAKLERTTLAEAEQEALDKVRGSLKA